MTNKQSLWHSNKLANEIFSVIMGGPIQECDKDVIIDYYNDSPFWENYGTPLEMLKNWINDNNVKKFRVHLLDSDIEALVGDVQEYIDELKKITDAEIIVHKNNDGDYIYMNDVIEKMGIVWDDEIWDHITREDLKYNSKYFYNGSDATLYTLIEKI